VERKWS